LYKHVTSHQFAARLESAIRTYARSYFSPPLSVFRDEKFLVPGPDLPQQISDALESSEYFILIASSEAARSPWVCSELEQWCRVEQRRTRFLIVLVDGRITIDDQTKHIIWDETDALPSLLSAFFTMVPYYLDCRAVRDDDHSTLADPTFKMAVNGISARLRGVDPDEMFGKETLQYQRNLRLRRIAIGLLAAVTCAFAIATAVAWIQLAQVRRQNVTLTANAYASSTRASLDGGGAAQGAAILALDGIATLPSPDTLASLYAVDRLLPHEVDPPVTTNLFEHRGKLSYFWNRAYAVSQGDNSTCVYDLATPARLGCVRFLVGNMARLSKDGRTLA
jgi:hypothetical protein